MIQIKSPREIDLMRTAGVILRQLREVLKNTIAPGLTTLDLDKIAEKFIEEKGVSSPFKNYNGDFPGSICTSVNEVVVHGIPSPKRVLKTGDIISIDLGITYKGYHADSAWTFPVGEISSEDQMLLDVTEKSLYVGIEKAISGNRVSDISHAIEEYIKPFKYGIVEDLTGHGIGRDLHEEPMVPNFGKPGQGAILQSGMTICIEPMINLGTKRVRVLNDNWTTITKDKRKSAHFEHTVLITENGYEILT